MPRFCGRGPLPYKTGDTGYSRESTDASAWNSLRISRAVCPLFLERPGANPGTPARKPGTVVPRLWSDRGPVPGLRRGRPRFSRRPGTERRSENRVQSRRWRWLSPVSPLSPVSEGRVRSGTWSPGRGGRPPSHRGCPARPPRGRHGCRESSRRGVALRLDTGGGIPPWHGQRAGWRSFRRWRTRTPEQTLASQRRSGRRDRSVLLLDGFRRPTRD
jgi:hypothetical protein